MRCHRDAPRRAARSGTGSPPSTAAPSDPRTPGTVRRAPRTGRSPRWTRRFPTQPPSARNRPLPRLRGRRTPTCSGADPPGHRPAGHPPGSTCPPNPLNLNRVAPTASGARVLQGRARFAYDKAKTRGLVVRPRASERERKLNEFSVCVLTTKVGLLLLALRAHRLPRRPSAVHSLDLNRRALHLRLFTSQHIRLFPRGSSAMD